VDDRKNGGLYADSTLCSKKIGKEGARLQPSQWLNSDTSSAVLTSRHMLNLPSIIHWYHLLFTCNSSVGFLSAKKDKRKKCSDDESTSGKKERWRIRLQFVCKKTCREKTALIA